MFDPSEYGLTKDDFYDNERGHFGLIRRPLQEDLYSIGSYILDKYKSFTIYYTQETFSKPMKEWPHRHRDYKGIYKYYFFIMQPKGLDMLPTALRYRWATFTNHLEYYEWVMSVETYEELLGLLWGSATFREWEERYTKENPRFTQKHNEWSEYYVGLLNAKKRNWRIRSILLRQLAITHLLEEESEKRYNYQPPTKEEWFKRIEETIPTLEHFKNVGLNYQIETWVNKLKKEIGNYWIIRGYAGMMSMEWLAKEKGVGLNTLEYDLFEEIIFNRCRDNPRLWLDLLDQ